MSDTQQMEYVSFNYGELHLPIEALKDCHHQGRCDDDVEYWHGQIDWDSQSMDADAIRSELSQYGAWDDEQLSKIKDNQERILWIAAGNWQDEQFESEA